MRLHIFYEEIIFLFYKATSNVNESKYSISAPRGTPWAIFDTLTPVSLSILVIYKAVVSPSILGFTAIITSSIFSSFILSNNFDILILSGSIPSSGDINP